MAASRGAAALVAVNLAGSSEDPRVARARDAADRGYMSVVVEDAVAEDRPDYHEWTLEQFRRLFGRVATTTEVISEISARLPASARR